MKYLYIALLLCGISHEANSQTISLSDLISGMIQVESTGNDSAFNESENAVGCLQIRPIMIREVNRILKTSKYKLEDRWNRLLSIEIFKVYSQYYTPNLNPELVARKWNGGPTGHNKIATLEYCKNVQSNIK